MDRKYGNDIFVTLMIRIDLLFQSLFTADLMKAISLILIENLLLQSSDWPFLITTWQAKDYATDRFREHVDRFEKICDMIDANSIDEAALSEIESIDNCFCDVDYRVYLPIEEGKIPQQESKLAPLYKD